MLIAEFKEISHSAFQGSWLLKSCHGRKVGLLIGMSKLAVAFILAGVCGFIFTSAAHCQLSPIQIELYKQGLALRHEADQKLIDQTEDCADWMVRFKSHLDHFPEPGHEQNRALDYLQNKMLKTNPFPEPNSRDYNRQPRIKFVLESRLSQTLRETWEKKPPENWKEPPGTITIITNNEKCVLIWGAGADGLPIFDEKAKTFRYAWREFD